MPRPAIRRHCRTVARRRCVRRMKGAAEREAASWCLACLTRPATPRQQTASGYGAPGNTPRPDSGFNVRELGHGRAGHAVAVLERAQGVQHHVRRHSCGQRPSGRTPTVFIAGDDTAAKAALADLITAGGCRRDRREPRTGARAGGSRVPTAHCRRRREDQLDRWLRRRHVNHGARSRPPSVLLLLGRCDRVAGEQLGADRVGDVG